MARTPVQQCRLNIFQLGRGLGRAEGEHIQVAEWKDGKPIRYLFRTFDPTDVPPDVLNKMGENCGIDMAALWKRLHDLEDKGGEMMPDAFEKAIDKIGEEVSNTAKV